MDLYDIAIARKLSGGSGGGGGSSDLSSAEVTLIPALENAQVSLYDPGFEEEPWGYHCFHIETGQLVAGGPTAFGEPVTITLYYTGESLTLQVSTTYVSSTGDVVYNSDDNTVTITGDCSITGYVED